RQTRPAGAVAAPVRALPPAARLGHVVPRARLVGAAHLVPAVPRPAARGRPRDAAAAAPRPVRRRAAGVGAGPGVPVPLLDVGGAAPGAGVLGTPGDRVAHRAARTVRPEFGHLVSA